MKGAESIPMSKFFDHHRLGAVSNRDTILFMNRPVGSTSTIIATSYEQAGIRFKEPSPASSWPPYFGHVEPFLSDHDRRGPPCDDDAFRDRVRGALEAPEEIFSVGSPSSP